MIYLDHNATTPLDPDVMKAMEPLFLTRYGNPSSIHGTGRDAHEALERARDALATGIGAAPEEIIFTSGGTEADNLAIAGTATAQPGHRRHIITSAVEHHAVLRTCEMLHGRGYGLTVLPVDRNGLVDPAAVEKAITPETVLATVMTANNETGTIQPIREISRITRAKGVLFHTDAVQALGKMPFNVKDLGIDLASFSAHKIYGPKGLGALYVKSGTALAKQVYGGGHEHDKRAGTENVPGAVGFAKALSLVSSRLDKETERLDCLRRKLWRDLSDRLPDICLNGTFMTTIPNTVNISFKGVEGEALQMRLDMAGVAVSSGSACTAGAPEPSHVLIAMGVDPVDAQGSLRFSLGKDTTEKQIVETVKIVADAVVSLRQLSPIYNKKEACGNGCDCSKNQRS